VATPELDTPGRTESLPQLGPCTCYLPPMGKEGQVVLMGGWGMPQDTSPSGVIQTGCLGKR
jgi:hypothetical protein